MSYIFAPGATSKSIHVQIVDDTGLPVTGLVAATFPATYYQLAGANAGVQITLADLAAITTAYSSGGVKEIDSTNQKGWYRLDLPNGALTTAGHVKVTGEATNKRLICDTIFVDQRLPDNAPGAANGLLISGSNSGTTTLGALTITGAMSINGTGNVAQTGDSYGIVNSGTHGNAALKTLIDAVDDYIDTELAALTTEVGKIPKSDGTASWNATALAAIQSEANDALVAYDGLVPADLPSNFAALAISAGGVVNADAVAISGDTGAADWLEREYDGTGAGELLIRTTIATRSSNSDFTLTAGSADNSAYLYGKVIVRDQSTSTQFQVGYCSVYTGATKRVQLIVDPGVFTTAVGDIVEIHSTEGYQTWQGDLGRALQSTGNEAIAAAILAASTGGVGDSVDTCLQRLDATVSSRASQTSVDAVDDYVDTEVAAIQSTLASLFTTALTEAYRADGATGSVAQLLYELLSHHNEASISSTTKTTKKVDGSTTAATFTLNSATTPASITRTS